LPLQAELSTKWKYQRLKWEHEKLQGKDTPEPDPEPENQFKMFCEINVPSMYSYMFPLKCVDIEDSELKFKFKFTKNQLFKNYFRVICNHDKNIKSPVYPLYPHTLRSLSGQYEVLREFITGTKDRLGIYDSFSTPFDELKRFILEPTSGGKLKAKALTEKAKAKAMKEKAKAKAMKEKAKAKAMKEKEKAKAMKEKTKAKAKAMKEKAKAKAMKEKAKALSHKAIE
jgi:hypothetical protein